jgi:hypothetical protein
MGTTCSGRRLCSSRLGVVYRGLRCVDPRLRRLSFEPLEDRRLLSVGCLLDSELSAEHAVAMTDGLQSQSSVSDALRSLTRNPCRCHRPRRLEGGLAASPPAPLLPRLAESPKAAGYLKATVPDSNFRNPFPIQNLWNALAGSYEENCEWRGYGAHAAAAFGSDSPCQPWPPQMPLPGDSNREQLSPAEPRALTSLVCRPEKFDPRDGALVSSAVYKQPFLP